MLKDLTLVKDNPPTGVLHLVKTLNAHYSRITEASGTRLAVVSFVAYVIIFATERVLHSTRASSECFSLTK